jgi:3',5'-cyclic AMP phosphodiesterase CpdA
MAIRILHTADWQLGKPFAGLSGDTGALLRAARFDAVRTIARLAREHEVDAVLVAGDVFDDNYVERATVAKALAAMREFDGPWLLLPGNHDPALAASVWTRIAGDGPPEQVRLATTPEPLPVADGMAVVLPAPLTERHSQDDLTAWIDQAATPAAAVRIGLAHGAIADRLPADADAWNPIAADRAERARLAYLALGDWHGTLQITARTWYAGTPEPDRYKANASGQVLLVEIDGPDAPPRITALATGHYRWRQVTFSCAALAGGLEPPALALRRELGDLSEGHRQLVQLRLQGCLGMAQRAELEAEIKHLEGELACLEVEDSELSDEPTAADQALLDDAGTVGVAARRLRELAGEQGEDAAVAALALRLLYGQASAVKAGR